MKANGKVSKLPQWAQQRITKLQADVKFYKDKSLEAARGGDARVVVMDYADPDDKRGLPTGSHVRFNFEAGYVEFSFSRDRPGAVQVRSSPGGLVIYGHSANVFEIRTEPIGAGRG